MKKYTRPIRRKNKKYKWQSDQGVMLLDTLLALSCLLIIASFIIPIMVHSAHHGTYIKQSLIAEENLSRLIAGSLENQTNQNREMSIQGYRYQFTTEWESNKVLGCLTWNHQKSNDESLCLYVPVHTEE